MARRIITIKEKDAIVSFLESISSDMCSYIKNNMDYRYMLVYKHLSHSDLTTKGKRNGSQQNLDKNFLYYLTIDEIKKALNK